jgi:hypothetical protein
MVDNSQKNAVHGNAIDYERSIQKATPDKITTTSIDHSMSLDDFTLLNAMDSSNSSAELSSDSSLRDLFPGAFDSLDFGSIFSSVSPSLLHFCILTDFHSRQIQVQPVYL